MSGEERTTELAEFDMLMDWPPDGITATTGVSQEEMAARWGTSPDAIAGQQALMGLMGGDQ